MELLTNIPLLVLFGLLLLAAGLAFYRLRETHPPYEKRESLLTNSELAFYAVLRTVAEDWSICAMVRIADLIRVRKETQKRQAWLNRILAKHVDFVLCDPETMEAVLAIELDDKSHDRPERQERDQFVNGAFAAAGLPLLRIPVQDEYNAEQLKASIAENLGA